MKLHLNTHSLLLVNLASCFQLEHRTALAILALLGDWSVCFCCFLYSRRYVAVHV